MSKDGMAKRTRTRQLLEIAKRYYVGDESMVSISTALGISRFKVARLLKEAKETGVVTINLNAGGEEDPELSGALAERLGLEHVVVVRAFGTVEEVRGFVGMAAAQRLSETLHNDEVLGLAWGRTLTRMIESLESLPDVQILQLNGSVGSDLSQSPIELIRRAALLGGNKAKALMAPLYIDNLEAAEVLRRQPDLKEVIDLYDTVTTAVVSIGAFRSTDTGSTNSQFLPLLSVAERDELLGSGAIAEVCGLPFCADGSLAKTQLVRHIIAIRPEQLHRVPRVIGVASDPSKAEAILAIWRADLISELVVDDVLAERLLALPPDSA